MDMTGIVRRIGTALLAAALGCAIAVAQGWQHLGKLQRVEKLKDGVELTAGAAKVRLTAVSAGAVLRGLGPDGGFSQGFCGALVPSPPPAERTTLNDAGQVADGVGELEPTL